MPNCLEVFIGCRFLVGCCQNVLNSFAVVSQQSEEAGDFKELTRTETVCNSSDPQYCTSFELHFEEEGIRQTNIRIDFYQRKTEESERLRDHGFVGKVTIPLESIFAAEGNHLTTQISHPSKSKKVGVLMLSAEEVDTTNPEIRAELQFDVNAAILRKRDWNKAILGQRYELRRAHRHDDCDGHTVWLPIYRSNRISKQHDSNSILEFSSVSLKYRHACNGDEERRMRLSIYAAATATGLKRNGGETLIGTVDFTLRDICEMDPTEEVLPIEGENTDDTDLGSVCILRAEPTDFGSHFSLQINHETTSRYTSAVSNEKQPPKRKAKEVARLISMNLRDRSSNSKKMDELFSPASALFENSFSEN